LPVYRVDLPRRLTLVVALVLMVAPTSVLAREFPAADTPSGDGQSVHALHGVDHLTRERSVGRLQIRVFHWCQPGEMKTIEQPRVGAIDFNQKDVALIGTLLPSMNGALPFPFRSFEHVQNVPDERISGKIPNSFRKPQARSPKAGQGLLPQSCLIVHQARLAASRFMRDTSSDREDVSHWQAEAVGVAILQGFGPQAVGGRDGGD